MAVFQYHRRILLVLIHERAQWILWLPVGLGIGIAGYFELPFEPPVWPSIAFIFSFFILCFFSTQDFWKVCAISGLMVSLGFAIAQWRSEIVQAPILKHRLGPVMMQGEIVRIEPTLTGGKVILDAPQIERLSQDQTPRRIRLTLKSKTPNLSSYSPGDIISALAILRPPPPPAMPGSFDFQRRAYFKEIGAYGFVLGDLSRIGRSEGGSFTSLRNHTEHLRQRISEYVRNANPTPTGAVAAALLTGHRGYIPKPTLEAIRDAGIAHLLAISGLHIGLVAGIVFAAIRLILATPPAMRLRINGKKIAALVAIPSAFSYAILAGFTVPTERALLMTCLILVGVLIDRRALTMRSVCWAAMTVLLFSPESLVGPGFQMSFAAVTALIAAYAWLSDRRRANIERHSHRSMLEKGVNYFGGVMLTTLIAGLATSPFAVYHFQHVAVFGLITNAIAVPIAALWVMPAGVLTMVTMPFSLDGVPLWIMFKGIDHILASATWIAALPGAAADVAAPSIHSLSLVTIGGLWLTLWKQNWRLFGLPVFVIGLMGPLYAQKPDIMIDGDARIVAVSGLEHDLMMSSSRRARFEAAIWQRRMGNSTKPQAWSRDGEIVKGGLRCDANGCIYRKQNVFVSISLNEVTLTEDCARNDLVIALVPIRTACQTRWGTIDRFDLWQYGTHAIYFERDRPVIRTVNGERGVRPWVNAPEVRQ